MLTLNQYCNFRNQFMNHYGNLPLEPSYNNYQGYEISWENYIINAANILKNGPAIRRIGLIVMESGPGSDVHPHPNYIFHNTNESIHGNGDTYLKNIFNGTHLQQGYYHNGLTKQNCLDQLLVQIDAEGNQRPVILLDILPTHGISLNAQARSFLTSGIINEIEIGVAYKFEFVNNNILVPLGLNWSNIHLKFACPPTTCRDNPINEPLALIPQFIRNNAPGIHIHPDTINAIGGGVAPNQNSLRDNIINHGF